MAGERIYKVANFVQATTAAPVEQPTGTAIRTMLQIATSTTMGIKIVEWGISFDGFAAAAPIHPHHEVRRVLRLPSVKADPAQNRPEPSHAISSIC